MVVAWCPSGMHSAKVCNRRTLHGPPFSDHACRRFPHGVPCTRWNRLKTSCSWGEDLFVQENTHPITRRGCLTLTAGLLTAPILPPPVLGSEEASGLDAFYNNLQRRVSEFTLENGLHFIVLERHVAPIVSCHIYADVGAYDEPDGQTGIAHLLEHMAFKGSTTIGTKNYKQEAVLLEQLDEAFYTLREAQQAGQAQQAAKLLEAFRMLQARADEVVVPNEFGSLLQTAGAVGLNATTSHDATKYYMSLPSNKLELWFALEAERFQAPVFRQLYMEKQVVAEERRMRIDNSPLGKFQEQFQGAALSNNYRRPRHRVSAGHRFPGAPRARRVLFRALWPQPTSPLPLLETWTPPRSNCMLNATLGGGCL
eukprot:jgi/Botrbrau1/14266/Bobra.113_2s0012.1